MSVRIGVVEPGEEMTAAAFPALDGFTTARRSL